MQAFICQSTQSSRQIPSWEHKHRWEFAKQNDSSYWFQTYLDLRGVADLRDLHERAPIASSAAIARELLVDQVIHQLAMIAAHATLGAPNFHKGVGRLHRSASLHDALRFHMGVHTLGLSTQARMVARARFTKSMASRLAGGWSFFVRSSPVRTRKRCKPSPSST